MELPGHLAALYEVTAASGDSPTLAALRADIDMVRKALAHVPGPRRPPGQGDAALPGRLREAIGAFTSFKPWNTDDPGPSASGSPSPTSRPCSVCGGTGWV